MKRAVMLLFLLLACAGLATPAAAEAPRKIGLVLLHGKLGPALGTSRGRGPAIGGRLIAALRDAGYLVAAPEMCWSYRRAFDRPYPDCLAEIDAAIADLKAHGATAIVVGGLSLGGNAAIAYGASHTGLLGIVGLSPADDPTLKARNPKVGEALAQARRLVAEGKGDEKTSFDDVNTGPGGGYSMVLYTTPRIYLSFYDAGSPANLPASAARLTAPLLWVAGDRDPSQRSGRAYAFDKAPPNPLNRYVTVPATHLEVPDAGTDAVLAWLAQLGKS